MTGTIINVLTILAGSFIGAMFGSRFSDKLRTTIMSGLGIYTTLTGVQMFLGSKNSIIVLVGLVIGTCLGEWWKIEEGLSHFGEWLQQKYAKMSKKSESSAEKERFIQAFLTAALLFCIGPIAILGSIQDGISGDYQLLVVKAILDGIASIAFVSTMGIGAAFSIVPLFIYQGAITLLANQVQAIMMPEMMTEMTATGGILLVGISFSSLLSIKKIRVASMMPGLFLVPLIMWIKMRYF